MDAAQALADLTEISSQIESAVMAEKAGKVLSSTFDDGERGDRVAKAAGRLLEESTGTGREGLVQLEAATEDGSVFVVRDDDRFVAAVTGPQPTVGLVFYDLKTCLRQVAEEQAASKAGASKASKAKKAEEPTQEDSKGGSTKSSAKTSTRTSAKRTPRKATADKKDEADNGS